MATPAKITDPAVVVVVVVVVVVGWVALSVAQTLTVRTDLRRIEVDTKLAFLLCW